MPQRIYILLLLFFPLCMNAQEQFSLYFDSDKYDLTKKEQDRLTGWINENTSSKIVAINGYTDEDGSSGYNDTLARRRVDFIYNKIKDLVKIREDFKSRSFGENHKLAENKAENRKVTIYYLMEKDLSRENEILGIMPVSEPPAERKLPEYPEKIVLRNPDGTQSEFRLDVDFMNKVTEAKNGEKLRVDDLNFQLNTFAIVKESRSKLYELLLILEQNPKMKISIQGHLCCVANDKQDLSTKRAKAVYGFLTSQGINKDRLTYVGFGSTKALYPVPEKDESQRAANRRVEIEIIENP